MHGWRGVLVLAAALVVTATGCLRAEVGVKVNDDRSGTVVVDLLVNKNNLESAGIRPDQLEQLVKTASKAMPGADVSTVDDDEQRGVHVEIPFEDYRQAVTAFTNFTFQNQPLHMFQELNIQEGSEGRWSMDATVDQAGILTILAQLPKMSPIAPLDPEDTEIVFSMTLPGEVERSNAYTIDGGTATWKLTGKDASTQLSVDNEPSSLDPLQIALVAVGGLIVVGFVLVLLTAARGGKSKKWVRRRRRRGRGGPDPAEQWKPTKPTPGTLGGRDESVLPVLPTGAPELPVIPPIGAGAMEGPRVAGVPTPAAAPAVDVPPAEAPVPEPVAAAPGPEPEPAPVAPEPEPEPVALVPEPEPAPVAPEPEPEPVAPEPEPAPVALVPEPEPVPVAPAPALEPEPVAPAPVEPQPASPQPYVVLSEWAMSDEGAVPVQWTMSESGAAPVEQARPADEPPPTTTPPTDPPAGSTQDPDEAHWLAPQPHQDPEGHWLDVEADEDAADPTNWPAPPPKEDVRVRREQPGDVEL